MEGKDCAWGSIAGGLDAGAPRLEVRRGPPGAATVGNTVFNDAIEGNCITKKNYEKTISKINIWMTQEEKR